MLGKLIGLAFGCVFVGALVPTAVTALIEVNTSTWGTAGIALWAIASLAVIGGVIMLILKEAGVEF